MDLQVIGIDTVNWFDSAQDEDLLENPSECGIELRVP